MGSRAFRKRRPCPFPEGGPEDEGKRRSGAPKGAPARVMGRQFPPAGGTGPIVRRANGCGVPRPRISALRFPLFGTAKGSKPTIWHDSPPGCAARQRSRAGQHRHGENRDAEICAPNSPPSCPRLSRASTPWHQSKAWMAGTSPAMTGFGETNPRTRFGETNPRSSAVEQVVALRPKKPPQENLPNCA